MKHFIITGIFLLTAGLLAGQGITGREEPPPSMNFQECVSYAWKHNARLSNGVLEVESQHLRYKGAINNYLPSVAANTGYGLSRGRSVDPNTNAIVEREFFSSSYGLNASMELFNGFRQHQEVRLEHLKLKSSEEELKVLKNELAFRVLNAFIQHLVNAGMVKIGQEQWALSTNELSRVKKMIELGLSSGGDLYEIESRVAADEYQLVQYRNMSRNAENALKRLMNFPADWPLQIETPELEAKEIMVRGYNVEALYQASLPHLPRLQAMDFQLKAAKTQMHMSWSAMLPAVWAYAGTGSGYYQTSVDEDNKLIPFQEQLRMNRRMSYGVSMSIPLFNRFRQHNTIQQLKIQKKQAENNFKAELLGLEYDIQQAILDWEGAIAEYQAALRRQKSMEAAFATSSRKREKGLISLMEFSEAKNKLAEAREALLKAALMVFLNEQNIRFYETGSVF